MRPFMKLYNIAYWAGMLWFAGFLFWAATRPDMQGAGPLAFGAILLIAGAPCAVLWAWKRWKTGTWIS